MKKIILLIIFSGLLYSFYFTASQNYYLKTLECSNRGSLYTNVLSKEIIDTYIDFYFCFSSLNSSLSILNLENYNSLLNLNMFNYSGTIKGSNSINSFLREGNAVVDPKNFFNGSAQNGDYVKLSSDRKVVAYESFGKEGETLAVLPGFTSTNKSKEFYIPHVACNRFGDINYYTKIILINPTDSEMSLGLYLYNDSGNILKSLPLYKIQPHYKKILDVADDFGIGNSTTTGYIKIESNDEDVPLLGSVVFGDKDSGKFISSLPITNPTNDSYLMGHIAKGEIGGIDYFTGIAILNSSSNSRTVKITCYDKSSTFSWI